MRFRTATALGHTSPRNAIVPAAGEVLAVPAPPSETPTHPRDDRRRRSTWRLFVVDHIQGLSRDWRMG
ncbi:hypothetical protein CCHR01_04391 [Colletotrichum chrysophilum]|uniref:Uncharacterized protein n=1 Tax=Colletotrichum chrysophilum TaxID=1836956 RepID=A0AAD9EQH7_9PEZI|nr:hypothetical protein CCHR01_04391 [Colletotrichum chrysophilum]